MTEKDMGHTAGLEELMANLKAGNTNSIAIASDDALIQSRTEYSDWAQDEQVRLKAEYDRCYNAVVAELAKRGLTGG
jgi:hypothetical protein